MLSLRAALAWLESGAGFRLAVALQVAVLALGLKRFVLWDQVLLLADESVAGVVGTFHPHALRWLLMSPVLALTHAGYDPHQAFTALCGLLTVATALLLARCGARLGWGAEPALRLWCFLPLALASLGMNGRLLPAFFGLSLLLALAVERPARAWLIAGQGVGLLCLSVSSGTFAVGVPVVLLTWWHHGFDLRRRWPLVALAAVALGALCAAYLGKALRFFAGDPMALLSHGPGGLLAPYGALVAWGGCALWVGAVLTWAVLSRLPVTQRAAAAGAAIIGLLGWSTLVTPLPLAALWFARWGAAGIRR